MLHHGYDSSYQLAPIHIIHTPSTVLAFSYCEDGCLGVSKSPLKSIKRAIHEKRDPT